MILQTFPHLQDVPVPRSREQRDGGAFALEKCVRRNGRPVNDASGPGEQLGKREVQAPRDLLESAQHTYRLIRRCRWPFCEHSRAHFVDRDEIGEGSTDVDPDIEMRRHLGLGSSRAVDKPLVHVIPTRFLTALLRRPPTTSASRANLEDVAGPDLNPDFLCFQHTWW